MADSSPLQIKEAMLRSADYLARQGIETARLDAEVLLGNVLRMSRLELYMAWDRPLDEAEKADYRAALKRRAAFEPVAYITGRREFFSLEIEVTPDVLIPRPETELLVERALEIAKECASEAPRVADIGTGSGAIAIAMARNDPRLVVEATDISQPALEIARANARRHKVEDRVHLAQASFFNGSSTTLDIVVSNPPYVPERDRPDLPRDVADYEPASALFAGEDGLDAIRQLLALAPERLRPGGAIVFEIGQGQALEVERLLETDGRYESIRIHPDYSDIPRVATARRRQDSQPIPEGDAP